MAEVDAGRVLIPVSPDLSGFRRELGAAVRKAVSGIVADVRAGVDDSGLRRELDTAARKASAGVDAEVHAAVDDSGLRREVVAAARSASAGVEAEVEATVDASGMRREVSAAAKAAGAGQKVTVDVDIDVSKFTAIRALVGKIDLPTGGPVKALALAAGLVAATAGAVQLVSALAPVSGLLGALPGLGAAAGQGIGTLLLSVIGVTKAFKALGQAENSAVTSSAAAGAAAAAQAAQRVRASQAVEDAQRRLQRAQGDAARVAVDGARRVADAERRLVDAVEDEVEAQRGVAYARRDARLALEDLNLEVQRGALDERGAVLAVQRARERLAEAQTRGAQVSALDRAEAALGYDEAVARLDEVRVRNERNAKELHHATTVGIEGSRQVVEARGREADASDAVRAAQQDVTEAVEGARQAQSDAAEAVADAQRTLTRSQADLTAALADSGAAGSSAMAQVGVAMAALHPAARRFVEVIQGLKPRFDQLRRAAEAGLFPGVTDAVVLLADRLFPALQTAVGRTAGVIGDSARSIAQAMTTPAFTRDFGLIADSNATLLGRLGEATAGLVQPLADVMVEARPLLDWLGDSIVRFSEWATGAAAAGRESGRMRAFFHQAIDTTEQLFRILGNTAGVLRNIGGVAAEGGRTMLDTIETWTQKFQDWTASVEGKQRIREFFDDVAHYTTVFKDALAETARVVAKDVLPNLDKLVAVFATIKALSIAGSFIGIVAAITAIGAPALLIAGAIGILVGAFVYAYTHSETFRDTVNAAFRKVKEFVAAVMPQISNILRSFVDLGIILWNRFGTNITIAATTTWRVIKNLISGALSIIGGVLDVAVGILTGDWDRLGAGLGQITRGFLSIVDGIFGTNLAGLLARASAFASTLGNAWGRLWDGVRSTAADIGGAVERWFSGWGGRIGETISGIVGLIGGVWDGVREKFRAPIAWVIEQVWNNGLVRAWNAVAGLIGAAALTPAAAPGLAAGGQAGQRRGNFFAAAGGRVPGPTDRYGRDDVHARLTRGEWVMPVSAVERYGPEFMRSVQFGALPGYRLGGDVQGLNPDFLAQLDRWANAVGQTLNITSGFRSRAEQEVLYARYRAGRGPVAARPGSSKHESGRAADVQPPFKRGQRGGNMAARFGLRFTVPSEDWHVEGSGAGGGVLERAVGWLRDQVGSIARPLVDGALRLLDGWAGGQPAVGRLAAGLGRKALSESMSWLLGRADAEDAKGASGLVPKGGAGPAGAGVERWRGVVNQALQVMGLPGSLADTTLRRMNQESSGRIDALNRVDVNWQRGYPSAGLMQVIRPTYQRHKHPGYDRPPFLYGVSIDPLSNILASMRYALGRYGSLPAAYNRKGGYAGGGPVELDQGGVFNRPWTGVATFARSASARPEVASPVGLMADTFARVLAQRDDPPAAPPLGVREAIHIDRYEAHDGADLDALLTRAEFALRAGRL